MLTSVLTKVFGTRNERVLKGFFPNVLNINSLEPQTTALSDEQLKHKTVEFKERLAKGETLDQILPEAFAVCREASKRVLGMRHFDVQLLGGMVLNSGAIAEMRTGEGKTLVATLPVYLNALSGKGVHVVTVNDYLAKRDSEWMGRLYKWLGMSVGVIIHDLTDEERKAAYGSDITYGTNNEFGFDYLRDNMKFDLTQYVQRDFNFAIVDEVDSILVDEARTPLIISGPAEESTDKYTSVNLIIPKLEAEVHYKIEEKTKTASLTEDGNHVVEKLLGVENLFDAHNIELLHHVYQALKAHHLYKRDVDYMIKDGEVVIVDEFTGRLMPGRRWSDGLHQAVEAKEGVKVANENQTLATVTFQNFFRMYDKLAGMTGTADTEAAEFKKIYNLEVVIIPTNRPMLRKDENDLIFKTLNAKFGAIAKDVKERNTHGQPVLVGTVSIEKSELLSTMMKRAGIKHTVLNAKYHEQEAEIVAQAGRKGSVTIATNMAGRGTDIVLGGNPEFMARAELGLEIGDETGEDYDKAVAKFKAACLSERDEVVAAGGLHIIGTERHESRRIDNQLRGRSGRQGDPGSTRFYLSLEDNLLRIFNGERVQKIMNMLNIPDDEAIESKMVTNSVEGAQRKVEGHNFDMRKHLLEYDDVMNVQREAIYGLRRQILEGDRITDITRQMLHEIVDEGVATFAGKSLKLQDWDMSGLQSYLENNLGMPLDLKKEINGTDNSESLRKILNAKGDQAYDAREKELGVIFKDVQKMLLLQSIDARWKEHLLNMDHMKEGINLRAFGQKDPLIEYKKEAFNLFSQMDNTIKFETLERMMKIQIVKEEEEKEPVLPIPVAPPVQRMKFSHGNEPVESKPVVNDDKIGRNDQCPCGSGKKYKKCHGANKV